jgi:hypothetical protein
MRRFLQNTVSAICYEIALQHELPRGAGSQPSLGEVERFVYGQLARMPRLLGIGVAGATAVFGVTAWWHGMHVFHRQQARLRALHWMRWKCSSLGPCRDLVRLYESLVVLFLYSSRGWDASGDAGL